MKKLIIAALLAASAIGSVVSASAQTYPSPRYKNLSVDGDVTGSTVSLGSGVFGGAAKLAMRGGGANRTYVGLAAGGTMTYFDQDSTFAGYTTTGQIGIVGASQSMDHPAGNNGTAIGVAAFCNNNNPTYTDFCWGLYSTVIRSPLSVGGSTMGLEEDVANQAGLIPIGSYFAAPAGVNAGLWLASGGESASAGITLFSDSAAEVIVSNGANHNKGIVFQAGAIDNQSWGTPDAIELGKTMEIDWTYDGSGQRGSFIRSDETTTGPGLVFSTSGLSFVTQSGTTLFNFDTSGNLTKVGQISLASGKVLAYSSGSSALVYQVGGTNEFTVTDAGTGTFTGNIAAVSASFAGLTLSSHITSTGTAPTTSNGTLNATATDTKGTVTEGTSSTGFVLTFATAYTTSIPDCIVTSPSGVSITSYSPALSTLTVVNASATGGKVTYMCIK